MKTPTEWLRPGMWALIGNIEYQCISRIEIDRRGDGIVLLRPRGVCDEDLVVEAISVDVQDLADLEAQGLVKPAQDRTRPADDRPCPHSCAVARRVERNLPVPA